MQNDNAALHIDEDTNNICDLCSAECGELAVHTYENGVCTVCGVADSAAALPIDEDTSVINVYIEWTDMEFNYG